VSLAPDALRSEPTTGFEAERAFHGASGYVLSPARPGCFDRWTAWFRPDRL